MKKSELQKLIRQEIKNYSDLHTVDDWLDYFDGASNDELEAELSGLKNPRTQSERNKRKAIIALLA